MPVLAVDLGGTKTAAALVRADGTRSALLQTPTPAALGPDAVLDSVAGLIDTILGQTPTLEVAGVGIGTAGVVDGDGRITSATDTFASWVGTDLVDGVRSRLRSGSRWRRTGRWPRCPSTTS